MNSAIFQQIWNIAFPLISLDQSTFISEGLQLSNLSCASPLIKQSLSTASFKSLSVQQVAGPLIKNKNSELTISDSVIQDITHDNALYSSFTLQTTVLSINNLTITNVTSQATQSNPIFSVTGSTASINAMNASLFSVQFFSFNGVGVTVTDSYFGDATNVQTTGLVMSLS